MTIAKDRVKPSPLPDSWKLKEIFATGIVLGVYLALMTVLFFWAVHKTDFFEVGCKKTFGIFQHVLPSSWNFIYWLCTSYRGNSM